VRAGSVHLAGLRLLAPHLNPENCAALLAKAAGRTKDEIAELVAALAPRPVPPTTIRKLPQPRQLNDTGSLRLQESARGPLPLKDSASLPPLLTESARRPLPLSEGTARPPSRPSSRSQRKPSFTSATAAAAPSSTRAATAAAKPARSNSTTSTGSRARIGTTQPPSASSAARTTNMPPTSSTAVPSWTRRGTELVPGRVADPTLELRRRVEAAGIEPASESSSPCGTTCLSRGLSSSGGANTGTLPAGPSPNESRPAPS